MSFRLEDRVLRVGFACSMSLLSLVLGACATQQLGTVKSGEEIAIVAYSESGPPPAIDISNKAIGRNSAVGGGGGAAIGALAGLSCGPFAIFCVPMGALAYGLVGAGGGAVVGAAQGLPAPVRDQLKAKIEDYSRLHNAPADLMTTITDKARGHWRLVSSQSGTVVTVRLTEMAFQTVSDSRVALAISVDVSVKRPTDSPAPQMSVYVDRSRSVSPTGATEKTFNYVGPNYNVRAWIEDKDEFVANSFVHAYRQIAENMLAELVE